MTNLSKTMRRMQGEHGDVDVNLDRQILDYYITPTIAVEEIIKRENFIGTGWEPACGDGHISKCFNNKNFISSDIRTDDSVYGIKGFDFLKSNLKVDYIITNPPYSLALDFVKHSLECATKVAMLLKIQFLESVKRYYFFKQYPPIRVWVFSKRISTINPNANVRLSTLMCHSWFIWEKGYKDKPTLDWIMY